MCHLISCFSCNLSRTPFPSQVCASLQHPILEHRECQWLSGNVCQELPFPCRWEEHKSSSCASISNTQVSGKTSCPIFLLQHSDNLEPSLCDTDRAVAYSIRSFAEISGMAEVYKIPLIENVLFCSIYYVCPCVLLLHSGLLLRQTSGNL